MEEWVGKLTKLSGKADADTLQQVVSGFLEGLRSDANFCSACCEAPRFLRCDGTFQR
jgi:hypothetical protein